MIRDGDRRPEDYPLHNFATRWGSQRTCVPVIAAQGCRQEVPEDERIQKGLLLCLGEEGKEKHSGKSFYPADTQSKPLACACHITSVVFIYIPGSIWWWESHGKQSSISQGVCAPRHPTALHFMKNGFQGKQHWATLQALPPPPGNRRNTGRAKSLNAAEKKETWFCLTCPFPIYICSVFIIHFI